jgi:hypothetical protein
MRALRSWAAALVSVTLSASTASAQAPLPGFVDNGSYTTITALGIDVYDVDAFRNRTFAQVLAEVQALGPDWRLATIAEVSPIFGLLDESSYLASARPLFGATTHTPPDGVLRYLTGGRVVGEPGSTNPAWGWLWGFGNGIQIFDPSTGATNYVWSSFGIGYDNKDVQMPDMGAWVIRDIAPTTTAPEPATVSLLGAGALLTLVIARRTRRGARS